MSGNWKQATLSCETFDYCCNWILSFSEEEGNLTLRVGIVLLKLFHFYFAWHPVLTFSWIWSWLCLCHLLVAALVNSQLIFPLPFGIMKMYWVYFYHFFYWLWKENTQQVFYYFKHSLYNTYVIQNRELYKITQAYPTKLDCFMGSMYSQMQQNFCIINLRYFLSLLKGVLMVWR